MPRPKPGQPPTRPAGPTPDPEPGPALRPGAEEMPEIDPADFGARLKKARTEAGLSQAYVAERLGVSTPRVSEWERGIHVPSATAVMRMIVGLGLEAATVFPEFVPKEKSRSSRQKA